MKKISTSFWKTFSKKKRKNEKSRLLPILKALTKTYPKIPISIDTFRQEIAESCLNLGASIINDIYAGEYDKSMLDFIGKNNIPYILMHMRGTPSTMQKNIHYFLIPLVRLQNLC